MSQPHVGIRADATPTMGVGHMVRCLALAEELLDRGCDGDRARLRDRGLARATGWPRCP